MKNEYTDHYAASDAAMPHHKQTITPVLPHSRDVFVPPQLDNDPLQPSAQKERQKQRKRRIIRHKMQRSKKEKAIQRRRQKRQRRLLAVLAVILVFVLWLLLRLLPIPFGALIVDGNENLSFDDVYRASGVPGYVNVIQLSPDEIQDRLSKDLRIEHVSVTREFPATIHVDLKERKAAAVITTMYGFAYVDAGGTVIDMQPQIKGVAVPIMTGKKMDTLLLGDTITDGSLYAALVYMRNISPELRDTIAEINVGNPENIIVYTTDSVPIHLGEGDHPAERAEITGELLQEVRDNHLAVQYIDTDVKSPLVKSK